MPISCKECRDILYDADYDDNDKDILSRNPNRIDKKCYYHRHPKLISIRNYSGSVRKQFHYLSKKSKLNHKTIRLAIARALRCSYKHRKLCGAPDIYINDQCAYVNDSRGFRIIFVDLFTTSKIYILSRHIRRYKENEE